jgi:hypothetical protein
MIVRCITIVTNLIQLRYFNRTLTSLGSQEFGKQHPPGGLMSRIGITGWYLMLGRMRIGLYKVRLIPGVNAFAASQAQSSGT